MIPLCSCTRIAEFEGRLDEFTPCDNCNHPDVLAIRQDDVHAWFGLSYASYLCVNRSLLQSMPPNWQHAFVKLMDELWAYFPDVREPRYTVHARDDRGRFIRDPIPNYNRGRTLITPADDYGS